MRKFFLFQMIPVNTSSKDYSGTFVYLSRSPEKSTVINSTTAVGQTHWNRAKSHSKPVPTIRKSLDLDKDEPTFTVELSHSPAGSNNLRLSVPTNYYNDFRNSSSTKNYHSSFSNPDPAPRITVRPSTDHPSSINELQNMYKNTTYLQHQDDLETYRVSSPKNSVNENYEVKISASPEKRNRRVNNDINSSNMSHSVASNEDKLFIPQHMRRSESPRKNSSFRKAVHQNSLTEADRGSGAQSQLSKRTDSICSVSTPSSLDHSTRKSDDRDSGAVLEPERYTHDFSSDCDEVNKPRDPTEKPDEQSRSSTPILPPLDEFNEDYDTGGEGTPDDIKPVLEVKPIARLQLQQTHDNGAFFHLCLSN